MFEYFLNAKRLFEARRSLKCCVKIPYWFDYISIMNPTDSKFSQWISTWNQDWSALRCHCLVWFIVSLFWVWKKGSCFQHSAKSPTVTRFKIPLNLDRRASWSCQGYIKDWCTTLLSLSLHFYRVHVCWNSCNRLVALNEELIDVEAFVTHSTSSYEL